MISKLSENIRQEADILRNNTSTNLFDQFLADIGNRIDKIYCSVGYI